MYRPPYQPQQQQQQQTQHPPQHPPSVLTHPSGVQQGFPFAVPQGQSQVQPGLLYVQPSLPSLPSAQSYIQGQGGQNWTYAPQASVPSQQHQQHQQHVTIRHPMSPNSDVCTAKDSNVTPSIYTGQSLINNPQATSSPLPAADTVTPQKIPDKNETPPPSDDTYILQLSSKDFFTPAIQQLLSKHTSPTISPSQSSVGSVSPARVKSEDVPVGVVEQTVGPKSKRQLSKEEAFVPAVVKKEKLNDSDDQVILIGDDDSQDAPISKKDDVQQPPPPMSQEEAGGQRLTDG